MHGGSFAVFGLYEGSHEHKEEVGLFQEPDSIMSFIHGKCQGRQYKRNYSTLSHMNLKDSIPSLPVQETSP